MMEETPLLKIRPCTSDVPFSSSDSLSAIFGCSLHLENSCSSHRVVVPAQEVFPPRYDDWFFSDSLRNVQVFSGIFERIRPSIGIRSGAADHGATALCSHDRRRGFGYSFAAETPLGAFRFCQGVSHIGSFRAIDI